MENKPKTAKKLSSKLLPTSKKIKKEAITATGKKNNEAIDDIFSTLKDKPKKKEKEELTKGVAFDKEKANKKSGGEKSKKNKFTEEGYKIYSVDELNIGRGGGTELCPFDCDCCF